jgi:GxxExxY protein
LKLLIDVKSLEKLPPIHSKQLLTYLRLTNRPLGLLMNFGGETFKEGLKRIVNDHRQASSELRVNAAVPRPFD